MFKFCTVVTTSQQSVMLMSSSLPQQSAMLMSSLLPQDSQTNVGQLVLVGGISAGVALAVLLLVLAGIIVVGMLVFYKRKRSSAMKGDDHGVNSAVDFGKYRLPHFESIYNYTLFKHLTNSN